MPAVRDKLGELDIATADAEETLYTCPTDTEATVKVTVTNRHTSAVTARVAHCKDGSATADKNYLEYDTSIDDKSYGSTTFPWTAMMRAGHSIRVRANHSDVTFAAEGIEHVAYVEVTSTSTTTTTTETTTTTTT